MTSIALEEGSANLLDRNARIAESQANTRETLLKKGFDTEAIESLWESLPQNVFLSYSPDQLEWTASTILSADASESVLLAIRNVKEQGVSELLVHAQDYDGLFAAVTTVIDEIGLDVLSARVGAAFSGRSFDLFQLMDRHSQALNEIDCERLMTRLYEVLRNAIVPEPMVRMLPRRLRPFKSTARIKFSAAHGGEKTLMDLACSDRPGLLSNISAVLVACGIRLHDARIATMGDRVEDAFILSDAHNAPLNREKRTELLQKLTETLKQDWAVNEPIN